MTTKLPLFLVITGVLLWFPGAKAESEPPWQHALSLYGSPKYPAAFQSLDYLNPDAPKQGHVRFAIHGTFNNLNPYALKGTTPSQAPGVLFYGVSELNEPLMVGTGIYAPSMDELYTAYGLIAKSVRLSTDRTLLEFWLRPEASFHDGHPVTSTDVVFSFKTLATLPHGRFSGLMDQVDRVEAPSSHHVVFHLKKTASFTLPLHLSELPVLPEHYWRGKPFNKTTLDPPLLSGPYRITKVAQGHQLEFERVDHYWGKALPINRGKYNFDKVTLDFYRDRHMAFQAFKAGRADAFLEGQAKNWADGYDFDAVTSGDVIRQEISHKMPYGRRFFVYNHYCPVKHKPAPGPFDTGVSRLCFSLVDR